MSLQQYEQREALNDSIYFNIRTRLAFLRKMCRSEYPVTIPVTLPPFLGYRLLSVKLKEYEFEETP